MSVLEFIAALKWPVVVLVALGYGGRKLQKSPGMAAWLRDWLNARNVRAKGPGIEFETSSATQEAVQTATATDEDLILQLAARSEPLQPQVQPRELRREAVEQLMRDAARWGWETAQMGSPEPPDPQVQWTEDGRPQIRYEGTLISRTLLMPERYGALTAAELRRRAESNRRGEVPARYM